MECPRCQSQSISNNGLTHYGKQRYRCKDCRRQFVENPSHQPITQAQRELVDRLLQERLSLAGIAYAAQVSKCWLQYYVNQKYYQVNQQVQVRPKKRPVSAAT
ncbi:IS1 family transposase [filamentous cyanobacterium LEGE 11480]|uniref:IS1 family transposase n=1 Tax=Romeriopsis navalis LEGE 11480 TaxID=2777977 RepID=A0A928VN98_9CYAN|nr:IS1 family transposase [Romeriopsis navalis LEGE 11480]